MYKRQQVTPFIIKTGGVGSGPVAEEQERIRISGLHGLTPDPFNINGSVTRVGISHNAGQNIDAIRSLLHLGYNTGEIAGNINLNDGWRDWMDIGTFTNNGRESMYFGLKQQTAGIISKFPEDAHFDAIVNWGDDDELPSDGVYSNLRFVYTLSLIHI